MVAWGLRHAHSRDDAGRGGRMGGDTACAFVIAPPPPCECAVLGVDRTRGYRQRGLWGLIHTGRAMTGEGRDGDAASGLDASELEGSGGVLAVITCLLSQ